MNRPKRRQPRRKQPVPEPLDYRSHWLAERRRVWQAELDKLP